MRVGISRPDSSIERSGSIYQTEPIKKDVNIDLRYQVLIIRYALRRITNCINKLKINPVSNEQFYDYLTFV